MLCVIMFNVIKLRVILPSVVAAFHATKEPMVHFFPSLMTLLQNKIECWQTPELSLISYLKFTINPKICSYFLTGDISFDLSSLFLAPFCKKALLYDNEYASFIDIYFYEFS
jgi:hypothetical protein